MKLIIFVKFYML